MPAGVIYDLFWMEEYRFHLIGCAVLVLGGIVLRWIFGRMDHKAEITVDTE